MSTNGVNGTGSDAGSRSGHVSTRSSPQPGNIGSGSGNGHGSPQPGDNGNAQQGSTGNSSGSGNNTGNNSGNNDAGDTQQGEDVEMRDPDPPPPSRSPTPPPPPHWGEHEPQGAVARQLWQKRERDRQHRDDDDMSD